MMKKRTINLFVMLLFCVAIQAQNQNENQVFLNAQFLILDEVEPLTQAQRDRMESIFNAEYAVFEIRDIAFNLAMSRTLDSLDYYAHYYRDEIAKRAYLLYNEELNYYSQKMGLNDASLETVKPKLKEQSEEIALYEMRVFAYPDILSSIKESINLDYEKEISDVYIRNEPKGLSHNLTLVLENRNRLNLSEQQVDSIIDAAYEIKYLIADGEITEMENNCWLYEREFIIQHLSEEQVGEFVVIRYAHDAAEYVNEIWDEAKAYKMRVRDSISVKQELYSYRINKLKIQYIYRDDKEKMREMENFWYKEACPVFLSQLTAERRRREVEDADDRNSLKF